MPKTTLNSIIVFLIAGLLGLVHLSCLNSDFNNPVDPGVSIPPAGLTGSTALADTEVVVSWSYDAALLSKTHFVIERKTAHIAFTQIGTTGNGKVQYTDKAAFSIDSTYSYRVRSFNDRNDGGYSNVSGNLKISFNPPTGLTAIPVADTAVQLTWQNTNTFGSGFEIERGTDGLTFALVQTVGANITTTVIMGVDLQDTTYYFRIRAKSRYNVSGYSSASIAAKKVGMVMVQGGTFQMGSTSGNSDEQPAHAVTLNNFWMDKCEVTRARWREVVMWKQGANTSPLNPDPSYFKGDDTLPVEGVSWDNIQTWIGYLNEKEGTTKYRLPTEAEWEYAARGGIHWQDNYAYSGSNNIDLVGWYDNNSGNQTHIVGTKSPNQLGIYDMTGNVWEWCEDWYGAYSSAAQTNPTGPATGSYRVLRGGSCYCDNLRCRVSDRYSFSPSSWGNLFGFRCVRDL